MKNYVNRLKNDLSASCIKLAGIWMVDCIRPGDFSVVVQMYNIVTKFCCWSTGKCQNPALRE